MNRGKKILSLFLKIALGVACVLIIYFRVRDEFGIEQQILLKQSIFNLQALLALLFCIFLIPVNWGIESKKWQLITSSVEKINFITSMKSVYSGVCLGNFAPGRATEFVGKILYFSDENKGKITVLHFVNGMIQLSITLLFGLLAISFKLSAFNSEYSWIGSSLIGITVFLLLLFILIFYRLDYFLKLTQNLLSRFL